MSNPIMEYSERTVSTAYALAMRESGAVERVIKLDIGDTGWMAVTISNRPAGDERGAVTSVILSPQQVASLRTFLAEQDAKRQQGEP